AGAASLDSLRAPPWSALFPYTTLFRSRAAEVVSSPDSAGHDAAVTSAVGALTAMGFGDPELGVDIADPETGASLGVAEAYWHEGDRKSTRLNSSHVKISYAVFCLKKKT